MGTQRKGLSFGPTLLGLHPQRKSLGITLQDVVDAAANGSDTVTIAHVHNVLAYRRASRRVLAAYYSLVAQRASAMAALVAPTERAS